jgi:drug/metabolite transporter (DMT)-like permease
MGAFFLAGYIAMVGVATFLLKYAMKDLSAYQLNLLMGIGMLVTGVPALWLAEGTLAIPRRALPLGALTGLLMAIGSISYVLALAKLPAGLAAAAGTSYVVVVIVLARVFLHESLDAVKVLGLLLTLTGVALLSFKS